jgi:alkanesulfonate monooxygenase SsuD/methylene tetrahydromethanopterin reductase-like flavin-dependent oxidoreductase (luciferase family)
MERVGLVIQEDDARQALNAIETAESSGVRQVWMTQPGPGAPDSLGVFTAAAARTKTVVMGTAVIPTYPRHPMVLAQQALSITDLAPGRLRLGVGPSHRSTVVGIYGLAMPGDTLSHLTEYVSVLRSMLWEGVATFHGRYFSVEATLPRPTEPPILISALRARAFRLAGAIADGAVTWLCPPRYLLETALQALREGADQAGRAPPPLIAHVAVAFSPDPELVLRAARVAFERAGRRPNYVRMFLDAGFSVANDGRLSDDLLRALVIAGDSEEVRLQLDDLLRMGIDELMVALLPIKDRRDEMEQLRRLLGAA